MPEQGASGTERIAAPPDKLYELVSDVVRMGDWSPENVAGRWLGGVTAPAVGARFTGSNRRGWRRWSTTCTVVAAEPGRTFSFDVAFLGVPVSRWTYEFQPDGDATIVTETWTDRRPGWFEFATRPTMGVADVAAHNEENIRATLNNLKAAVERTG